MKQPTVSFNTRMPLFGILFLLGAAQLPAQDLHVYYNLFTDSLSYKKDGEAVHKIGCGTGQMRNITGLSLSVGALMLAKKELKTTEPGIYSPEGLVKPESFIREFSGKDLFMYEDVAMAHPVKP